LFGLIGVLGLLMMASKPKKDELSDKSD